MQMFSNTQTDLDEIPFAESNMECHFSKDLSGKIKFVDLFYTSSCSNVRCL